MLNTPRPYQGDSEAPFDGDRAGAVERTEAPAEPYTFAMSTDDDLRRAGQAAAALMGVAAARAKQVADQLLLRPSDHARQEARHKAGALAEEGRRAAADVVSALRREVAVVFGDLERLEHDLRGEHATTSPATQTGTAKTAGEAGGRGAKVADAANAAGATKGSGAAKSADAAKGSGAAKSAGKTKASGAEKSADAAKAPRSAKGAGATQTVPTEAGPTKTSPSKSGRSTKAAGAPTKAPTKDGPARKAASRSKPSRGRS